MSETFYLISGNIDDPFSLKLFHDDILEASKKTRPHILFVATASAGSDWHEKRLKSITETFNKEPCSFEIIDQLDAPQLTDLSKTDIIYFLDGSPYKHSHLSARYRETFKQVPVKVGFSAGAIYLGNQTFYFNKDDYLVAVPEMLGFLNIHVFPHAESFPEEMVCNYLAREIRQPYAKLYNNVCIKVEKENEQEKVYILKNMDNDGKVDFFFPPHQFFSVTQSQKIVLPASLFV